MRRTISPEIWQQARTANATGIGLRELARNMNLPEGTMLARAKREGWTRQIQQAQTLATSPTDSPTVSPADAAAVSLADLGKQSKYNLAKATYNASSTLADMPGEKVLQQAQNGRHIAAIASTVHSWDQEAGPQGTLSVDVVTGVTAIRVRSQ